MISFLIMRSGRAVHAIPLPRSPPQRHVHIRIPQPGLPSPRPRLWVKPRLGRRLQIASILLYFPPMRNGMSHFVSRVADPKEPPSRPILGRSVRGKRNLTGPRLPGGPSESLPALRHVIPRTPAFLKSSKPWGPRDGEMPSRHRLARQQPCHLRHCPTASISTTPEMAWQSLVPSHTERTLRVRSLGIALLGKLVGATVGKPRIAKGFSKRHVDVKDDAPPSSSHEPGFPSGPWHGWRCRQRHCPASGHPKPRYGLP